MDSAQIRAAIEDALRDPRTFPLSVYAAIIFVAALGAFLGAYLKRKGENIATKEDVEELTERVERVRSQHAERLEMLAHENRQVIELSGREHQMRMAALDKRLEAHQQAFALWRKLLISVNSDQISTLVSECQTWWENNCLYLDPAARKGFFEALRAANHHKFLLHPASDQATIRSNFDIILAAGDMILSGASLPPLSDLEKKSIVSDMPAAER